MIRTKHISLDDECIKRMEPFINRHQGNFSAAIREIINLSEHPTPENSCVVDESLFRWLLEEANGRLIPENIIDIIIDPLLIKNMDQLNRYINRRLNELNWKITLNIKYDDVSSPSRISIGIIGASYKINVIALILSQFIIKNSLSPFKIISFADLGNDIKIELSKAVNNKEARDSLITFFGDFEDIAQAAKSHPAFWKCIVNRHVMSDYNMVTVHKNYYEDILAGKIPMGETMIEILAKKPIQDIPHKELLSLIKQVYETSRAVYQVEIKDNNIILIHNYRNKDAIEKIKKSLIMLLEANGHLYDGRITANMIVFEHRPDIGIEINKIVNNLKMSDSRLDQELIVFLGFIRGLKNMQDTSLPVSVLGRRIGTSLMQEYEKENNVKRWDLENFQKAFMTIDAKIHRDSEWKLDGKSLLYRIKKCDITKGANTFDIYMCKAAREAFKGAMNYAFGNSAELNIEKLITHGDNCCEVTIRLL